MNILIPNGPGPKNLGDIAIFEGLLSRLKDSGDDIVVHSFDPEKHRLPGVEVKPDVYYWATFENRNAAGRFLRTFYLLLALVLPESFELIFPRKLKIILEGFKNADRVILKGGGYFRSKKGLTQQLNAIMNGVYILFAKKYKKHVTIRPMSFGPFANKLTERICAKCVSLADVVQVRDKDSFNLLQKYMSPRKIQKRADEAYLLPPVKAAKPKQKILGFTIREWVEKPKHRTFIKNMATLIEQTALEEGCYKIQPIIQVDAPEYSEGDRQITNQLSTLLKNRGLNVLPAGVPKNVNEALRVYGRLSYLIGTRMHSCIFAHIQGVPFTAIAYEHKHSSLERLADEVIPIENLSEDEGLKGPMTSSSELKVRSIL